MKYHQATGKARKLLPDYQPVKDEPLFTPATLLLAASTLATPPLTIACRVRSNRKHRT